MALLLCIDEPPPLVFLGLNTIHNLCWTPRAIKKEGDRWFFLGWLDTQVNFMTTQPPPLEGMSTGMIFCKWAQLNTPRW